MAGDTPKDEKTEDGTARRFEDARKKGQVAYSAEFSTAVGLVAATLAFLVMGGRLARGTGNYVVEGLGAVSLGANMTIDARTAAEHLSAAAESLLPLFLLFILPLVVFAAISGYSQVGFRIAGEAVSPDFSKLSPVKGFGKIFSMRGVVRTALAILKITVLAVTMISAVYLQRAKFAPLAGEDLRVVVAATGGIVGRAALAGVLVIVLLSVIDLIYQRFQHKRDMRMSKQEVKEEAKSMDGDPKVKARIRQLQREMAGRRMMADVPDATVVLTNPTHYAVALRYVDDGQGGAPRVVAKGVDDVAQRIKQVAREAGVLVYEDPPLARALHRSAEIGDEIPAELFGAVARVLAYVFRLEGRSAGA